MKKITLMLCLITAFSIQSDAQTENQLTQGNLYAFSKAGLLPSNNNQIKSMYSYRKTDPGKDYNYYMKKSKKRKTVGFITLGAGLAFAGIGILIASNDNTGYNNNNNGEIAAGFMVASAVSGLVSIPFMAMAMSNRHKAKLLLQSQPTGFGMPAKVSKYLAGVCLAINI